ncbi:unnamed protein product [Protopolystoma xenopodis]|uniref:Uncharacterized protein n=1 Tax=Protopolystoma xenopodis TaxID=117903 RepID=A0A448WQW5_9PLAT|nr:unnamed protein product [Protopolystoma xenopodis]
MLICNSLFIRKILQKGIASPVEKEKNRKVKIDDSIGWQDSPDRAILSLAGLGTQHSQILEPPNSSTQPPIKPREVTLTDGTAAALPPSQGDDSSDPS